MAARLFGLLELRIFFHMISLYLLGMHHPEPAGSRRRYPPQLFDIERDIPVQSACRHLGIGLGQSDHPPKWGSLSCLSFILPHEPVFGVSLSPRNMASITRLQAVAGEIE